MKFKIRYRMWGEKLWRTHPIYFPTQLHARKTGWVLFGFNPGWKQFRIVDDAAGQSLVNQGWKQFRTGGRKRKKRGKKWLPGQN